MDDKDYFKLKAEFHIKQMDLWAFICITVVAIFCLFVIFPNVPYPNNNPALQLIYIVLPIADIIIMFFAGFMAYFSGREYTELDWKLKGYPNR